MIQLDGNFQSVKAQVGGMYVAPPAGGYVFRVLEVSEAPSDTGKPMVTLTMDVHEGPHKGVFEKYPKKYRQLVNGDSLPFFKGMLSAFQASNPTERLKGLVNHALQCNPMVLKDCLVGGLLRDQEYKQKDSGEIRIGQEVAYLCAVSEVPNLKPAPIKRLTTQGKPNASHSSGYSAPNGAPPPEDDLPF
jgi:hypothetical protein